MMTDTPTVPALVGLGPGPTTGVPLLLARHHQLVGRAESCDIRLIEAQVGAQHAVLTNREGRAWVQDLGTPGGTFVNGQRLGGAPQPLRRGDVVVFGTVALRLEAEAAAEAAAETEAPPAERADSEPDSSPAAARSRDDRLAWHRDTLMHDIGVLRARAHRLLGFGGVAFVLGFGLFTAGVLGLMTDAGQDRVSQPLGRDLLGVPCGLLGWGISAVGMVLLVAGFVLHVVAAGRYRRVAQELPWRSSRR